MNQQLEEFFNHLNEAVITTNDFSEGTRFRKREKVSQFAYCRLNPVYRSYLSFDLDYPGAGREFEELHIPAPSIITTNRENGHSHYLYRLITPVAFHEGGRSKPQDFFEAIEREMTVQLKADPACKVKVSGHGDSKKLAQQISWDRVNAIIRYLVERQGISSSRIIFEYGTEGDALTVDLMGTTEEGPNSVPAPHPNLRK